MLVKTNKTKSWPNEKNAFEKKLIENIKRNFYESQALRKYCKCKKQKAWTQ